MPNANALSTGFSAPDRAAVQSLLGEAFRHFRTHLALLPKSSDPEMVHQARVGWRRFKSAMHLFKPLLQKDSIPAHAALKPMLKSLSRLRDLDVARFQTLPNLSRACLKETPMPAQDWRRLTRTFADADRQQRRAFRAELQMPDVQDTLNAVSQWIAELASHENLFVPRGNANGALHSWARRRVRQMHKTMRNARVHADTVQSQHRVRILAKRLRYSIEMLRDFLPHKAAEKWHLEAIELQTRIGQTRDMVRANALARELKVPPGIAERLQSKADTLTQGAYCEDQSSHFCMKPACPMAGSNS